MSEGRAPRVYYLWEKFCFYHGARLPEKDYKKILKYAVVCAEDIIIKDTISPSSIDSHEHPYYDNIGSSGSIKSHSGNNNNNNNNSSSSIFISRVASSPDRFPSAPSGFTSIPLSSTEAKAASNQLPLSAARWKKGTTRASSQEQHPRESQQNNNNNVINNNNNNQNIMGRTSSRGNSRESSTQSPHPVLSHFNTTTQASNINPTTSTTTPPQITSLNTNTPKYYMILKSRLAPPIEQFTMQVQRPFLICAGTASLCSQHIFGSKCLKAHPKDLNDLIPLTYDCARPSMLIDTGGLSSRHVTLKSVEITVGYLFASMLLSRNIVKICQPKQCKRYQTAQGCSNGERCLYVHAKLKKLKKSEKDQIKQKKTASSTNTNNNNNTSNDNNNNNNIIASVISSESLLTSPCDNSEKDEPHKLITDPSSSAIEYCVLSSESSEDDDCDYDEAPTVPITADTSLMDCLGSLRHDMPHFLGKCRIRTVGELQFLSKDTFDAYVANAEESDRVLWQVLNRLRSFEQTIPIQYALMCFSGITPDDIDEITSKEKGITILRDLLSLKSRQFHALDLNPKLQETCAHLRKRYESTSTSTFQSISLSFFNQDAWIRKMSQKVLDYSSQFAHKSWRKQDNTRPIVTCLISYVELCKCKQKEGNATATSPQAAMTSCVQKLALVKGANGSGGVSIPLSPGPSQQTPAFSNNNNNNKITNSPFLLPRDSPDPLLAVSTTSHNISLTEDDYYENFNNYSNSQSNNSSNNNYNNIPWPGHWCTCPRKHELALNYELSTPSGSRCSEQNCLGILASKGVPTDSIREVFVHGGNHSPDTNPLFPCGVCENMLRRISKDVHDSHANGDILIFMFDQERDPRKLVCIPVMEISHRNGAVFKKFIEEDLRDD